jgi:predicted RNA binding protein YcfA (HicA-like mRNA interferase family)
VNPCLHPGAFEPANFEREMATTAELIRRLRRAGFRLIAHGKKHDVYENSGSDRRVIVPRHSREIPNGTYHSMLRDAGLD